MLFWMSIAVANSPPEVDAVGPHAVDDAASEIAAIKARDPNASTASVTTALRVANAERASAGRELAFQVLISDAMGRYRVVGRQERDSLFGTVNQIVVRPIDLHLDEVGIRSKATVPVDIQSRRHQFKIPEQSEICFPAIYRDGGALFQWAEHILVADSSGGALNGLGQVVTAIDAGNFVLKRYDVADDSPQLTFEVACAHYLAIYDNYAPTRLPRVAQ